MKPDHAQATAVTDALNLDPARTHHRGRLAPATRALHAGPQRPPVHHGNHQKGQHAITYIRSLTAAASSLNLLYVNMMTR